MFYFFGGFFVIVIFKGNSYKLLKAVRYVFN